MNRPGVVSISARRCALTLTILGVSAIPIPSGLQAAAPEPVFPRLTVDHGKPIALQSLRGQMVIVNFWASWCVPCRAELSSLEELAAARAGQVVVIAASVDVDPRVGRTAFGTDHKHVRLAFASMTSVGNYGALGMPYTIILDKRGAEVRRITRAIDWSGPEAAQLLAQAG